MTHFPVSNSNLSATHIGLFLQEKYSLSKDTKCKLIKAGINDTYLVTGNSDKFVFRVYSLNWRSKMEIDEAIKAQTDEASKLLSEILASDNVEEATQKALPQVTQIFVDLLRHELQNAQNTKDEPKAAKLQTIVKTLQAASASGIYLEVIDALVQAKDETEINKILEEAKEIINDDFLQLLSGLINQVESQGEEAAMVQRLRDINRSVLRFSMQQNLNKN